MMKTFLYVLDKQTEKEASLWNSGNALLKNGYRIKIMNTINFKKSMHYNPFAYILVWYKKS